MDEPPPEIMKIDERIGVESCQRFENGVGGADGFGGGGGMASAKIAEAVDLVRGFDRRCDDASRLLPLASDLGFESGGHGVRGLADGDDEDAIVGIEMVEVFADAQDAALAVHVAGEGGFDGGVFEGRGEYLAGGFAHAGELLLALGSQVGHGRDYRDSCWLLKVISLSRGRWRLGMLCQLTEGDLQSGPWKAYSPR